MRHRRSLVIPSVTTLAAALALAVAAIVTLPGMAAPPAAPGVHGTNTCFPIQVLDHHPDSVTGIDDTTYRLTRGTLTVAAPGPPFSAASASRAVRAVAAPDAFPPAIRRLVESGDKPVITGDATRSC